MKNNIFIIILLLIMLFPAIKTSAQTPFDVFSPETSRIILDGDSIASYRPVAAAPFTDEIKNWLSVE